MKKPVRRDSKPDMGEELYWWEKKFLSNKVSGKRNRKSRRKENNPFILENGGDR